jgi:hypothetical protein
LIALNTPIADPLRISVASQVARLESGQIAPDKFDYRFLRLYAGRFGYEALATMSKKQDGPGATVIATRARQALGVKTWSDVDSQRDGQNARTPPPVADRLANITVVYPKGTSFPVSLLEQDWTTYPEWRILPDCILKNAKCEAALIDLDDDGINEVLLFEWKDRNAPTFNDASAFKLRDDKWTFLGTLTGNRCPGIRDALRTEQIKTIAPLYKDIQVGGQRMRVDSKVECAPAAPSNASTQEK